MGIPSPTVKTKNKLDVYLQGSPSIEHVLNSGVSLNHSVTLNHEIEFKVTPTVAEALGSIVSSLDKLTPYIQGVLCAAALVLGAVSVRVLRGGKRSRS